MLLRGACRCGFVRDPDAAAFAARGFAHQAELVFAGNRGRVNLDELAVGVIDALLEERGLRGAGADDGIRGAAENRADAAGAENHGVGGKGFHFHGAQIHGANAAADSAFVDYGGQKSPAFAFFTLPSDSWRRTCSSSAYRSCWPVVAPANAVR